MVLPQSSGDLSICFLGIGPSAAVLGTRQPGRLCSGSKVVQGMGEKRMDGDAMNHELSSPGACRRLSRI